MKRETLIRSLKRIVKRLNGLDLPVTVEAFYGYGSALRGKENPGDLDLVLVYSMTEEQKQRWKTFEVLFKEFVNETEKMPNLWKIQQEMSLPEYLSLKPVNQIPEESEIATDWAKTYSWSNTLYQFAGFHPHFVEVTRRCLLKNIKGVQIFRFEDIKGLKPTDGRDKDYLLWSPETPDIDRNFEKVPVHEIVQNRIDDFIAGFEKQREQLMEVQPEIVEEAKNVGINLSFEKLNSLHPQIKYHKKEAPDKLREKCELARTETKKCMIERQVLHLMVYALKNWHRLEKWLFNDIQGLNEEKFTLALLKEHEEKYLKEKDLRKVLKILDLPEDHVITMYRCWKHNGTCAKEYVLEPDPLKRKELVREAKIEKKRAGYISAIRRKIQKINKNFWVYVEMADIKPQNVGVYFDDYKDNSLIPFLKEKGFTIKEYKDGGFFAEITIPLEGNETKKEIVGKVVSICHEFHKSFNVQ